MHLVTYQYRGEIGLGVVRGDQMVQLERATLDGRFNGSGAMIDLIAGGRARLDAVRLIAAVAGPQVLIPLAKVRLLAPVPRPPKNVICVGMNYLEHAIESARARGQEYAPLAHPAFFTKAISAVTGPYDDIAYPAPLSEQMDWEVELAVVIGARGRDWTPEQVPAHIFGYTVVNDVSARDVQYYHGGQFFKGKSLDGFCPMGPWIVTADEVPDPQALRLTTRVNGVVKQDGTTHDMIFDIPHLLAELSQGMTLEPGDVIATGTPSGVGNGRTPKEFLRPGDVVEVTVDGIGALRNRVVMRGA